MAARSGRLEAATFAALALFALFTADLLLAGPITRADLSHSVWVRERMEPQVTQLLLFVTHWHGTVGILAMSALLGLLLFAGGRTALIPWLFLSVQGGQLLNVLVKHLVERARPQWDNPLLTLASYSFPSGHAAGSTVFWGFACVVAWNWPASAHVRREVLAFGVLMVALVSFSRVYLGVHFASDVLAGICEGIAWLCACLLLRRALTMRAGDPQSTR